MYVVTICELPIRCESFEALRQLVRQVAELPGQAPAVKVVIPGAETPAPTFWEPPRKERRKAPRGPKEKAWKHDDTSARTLIKEALTKAGAAGMDLASLRMKHPKMDPIARRNALQRLKVSGAIKRAGTCWVAVGSAPSEA